MKYYMVVRIALVDIPDFSVISLCGFTNILLFKQATSVKLMTNIFFSKLVLGQNLNCDKMVSGLRQWIFASFGIMTFLSRLFVGLIFRLCQNLFKRFQLDPVKHFTLKSSSNRYKDFFTSLRKLQRGYIFIANYICVCVCVCLSVYQSVCLSACLSVSQ